MGRRPPREPDEAPTAGQGEDWLRDMVDHAPVVLWTTDASGACTYLNRQWFELTGQTQAAGLGDGWLEMVHPEDLHRAREAFRDAIAARAPFRADYRMRARSGEYRWVIDSATPRFDARGAFVGHAGSVLDISDRKRAEEERARLLREAQQALWVRDEFLSVASHELRTPLAAVQLQIQGVLRDGERHPDALAPRLRDRLVRADRSADRLGRLIGELLDVTRADTGNPLRAPEPVDLAALVASVVRVHADAARHAGSEIVVHAPEPVIGSWERGRLELAASGLVRNAIKYGGGRPIHVAIRKAGAVAEVEVTDRGIGIDSAHQRRIFERFERAVSSRNYGGFGLGLWLVRRNVEAYGGTITVASRPGEGATFTIRLPLLPGAGDPAPSPRP